ncbi:hypothetical protein [Chitinimonas sp. BJB300]|uniref:hypothetical protein n=1 Tax=Chitinimonas sp. BJB300 TaxID=1559339 RepID=UPI000C11406A|nr:hypothetical protein [Chitinimonas sp. BJB300]PHV10202.1 hypothetical protein CSQ89_17470 [Chitinimonas sp. BJB300]TSJ83032.1 hypothetical protein FG002_021730 [Chitinimonas sp. BJB300]
MWPNRYKLAIFILVGAAMVFSFSSYLLSGKQRRRSIEDLQVVMPSSVQLLMALGDRHLAANVGAFRAQTVGTDKLKPETYLVLARVQLAVAQLNPRHEDNYYTAAAILAWNGQTEIAQQILERATKARKNDYLPPFFSGFNRYYFYKDYKGAAKDILIAAERTDSGQRAALSNIASRWIEKGYESSMAIKMLDGMSKSSGNPRLNFILQGRIERLKALRQLQDSVYKFQLDNHRPPKNLQELVSEKYIEKLPVDPMGLGFLLDKNGVVTLNGTR